jgi:uncharacterized protein (DUF169 family)
MVGRSEGVCTEKSFRDRFIESWSKYFGDAELPLAILYSDSRPADAEGGDAGHCIVETLSSARKGKTLCFDEGSTTCSGAKRYFGFTHEISMPDFEYFLSYGIPGKVRGERYKKSPEIVRESEKYSPSFEAPGKYIVFKRWDKLSAEDDPLMVVFFADQDVVSGLFVLANFDETEPNAVICPFGSGCSSIVSHPYRELKSDRPRCVMGMFDISARPYVGENTLTFAVPITKFKRMVENMGESFLTTDSWKELYGRMQKKG